MANNEWHGLWGSIPSNNLANRHVVLKTGLLLSRAAALQWNLHTDRTLLSGSAVSCELAGWKAPMPEAFNEDLNRPWLINPIVNRARADSVNTGKGREWNKTDVKKKNPSTCLGITSMLRNQLPKGIYFYFQLTPEGFVDNIFLYYPPTPPKPISYINPNGPNSRQTT